MDDERVLFHLAIELIY